MIIRACKEKDIPQLCDIYNYYITNTVITFEDVILTTHQLSARISEYTQHYPWLVCEVAGRIVGYAYASKWKERSAYKNTAEVTVYLHHEFTAKGYGKSLYHVLIDTLKQQNSHVLLACISLPNQASIAIHESFGFKKVAHFSEVGFKFNQWIDVGYWQKIT